MLPHLETGNNSRGLRDSNLDHTCQASSKDPVSQQEINKYYCSFITMLIMVVETAFGENKLEINKQREVLCHEENLFNLFTSHRWES
jgi:hypothetical protein